MLLYALTYHHIFLFILKASILVAIDKQFDNAANAKKGLAIHFMQWLTSAKSASYFISFGKLHPPSSVIHRNVLRVLESSLLTNSLTYTLFL